MRGVEETKQVRGYDEIEALVRSSIGSAADRPDPGYREFRRNEINGLEDALSALHGLVGRGCNHAFICQALKQRYLRWLDSGSWADPAVFKRGIAFSAGYHRLVHELERMESGPDASGC